MRSGVRWKALSTVVVQVTRIVTAIVIARLVTPEEFGDAALVLMFSTLAIGLVDLSLGSALVQRRSISEADRSTAFWTSAAVGVVLALGFALLAGPISSFFDAPAIYGMLVAYSVTFVINGLSTTQATLLTRNLQFRRLEVRVIVATLISAPVGIVAAAYGAGAWAIILQALTYAGLSLPLLWVASGWRPRFVYSLASLRDLGGFGINVLGTQLLRFVKESGDTILIGRFLGASSVGIYAVAFNLTMSPLSRIVQPVHHVIFPAFSRLQHDRTALADAWLRTAVLLTSVVAPAMAGMIVVAPTFVEVVLGDRWLDAVPVIQALCVVALLTTMQQAGVVSVLLALDRSGTYLRFTFVTTAASFGAFVAGLPWGIVGVAVAYALVTIALFPAAVVIVSRALGIPARRFVARLAPVVVAAAAMAGIVLILRLSLPNALDVEGVELAILIVAGVASYLAFLAVLVPEVVGEMRRFIPLPRTARAPS